ncbi:MAG: hypothetical protein WC623_21935 [Pedobacter sp.]
MNKQWLIKIQDNIYYDSEERVYRYKMHCPNCKQVISTCVCYTDLDTLLMNIDDGIADFTCSSKCALLLGEWDELDEAMQEAGLERDVNIALTELTSEQLSEEIKKYTIENVVIALVEKNSKIPMCHLKNLSHSEQLEILQAMGDVKDVLQSNNINIYPNIEDLTEEQAKKLLDILTENADFDTPSGDFCNT